MNKRNILERIHLMLSGNVQLAQMKLDNGTVVEAESFEEGATIYAIDGDNQAPLEVGTYTMEDGMTFEVVEIGVIGKMVKETEATKEEEKTEMSDDLILAVVEALKPTFEAMNERIETLVNSNTELKATLSKVTAVKPTVHKPANKFNFSELSNKENLSSTEARIMKMLSNN